MTEHHVKCDPPAFEATVMGEKVHEIRVDDRDYLAGDVIVLHEYDRETGVFYSRSARLLITYKSRGGTYGIPERLCVLSIRLLDVDRIRGDQCAFCDQGCDRA